MVEVDLLFLVENLDFGHWSLTKVINSCGQWWNLICSLGWRWWVDGGHFPWNLIRLSLTKGRYDGAYSLGLWCCGLQTLFDIEFLAWSICRYCSSWNDWWFVSLIVLWGKVRRLTHLVTAFSSIEGCARAKLVMRFHILGIRTHILLYLLTFIDVLGCQLL